MCLHNRVSRRTSGLFSRGSDTLLQLFQFVGEGVHVHANSCFITTPHASCNSIFKNRIRMCSNSLIVTAPCTYSDSGKVCVTVENSDRTSRCNFLGQFPASVMNQKLETRSPADSTCWQCRQKTEVKTDYSGKVLNCIIAKNI